jgi:hypothetical protein
MKRFFAAIALAAASTFALAAADPGNWKGVVTDSKCGEKGASAGVGHAACATKCVKEKGASWALWDPAAKKLYILEHATDAEKLAGQEVTVSGTLESGGDKIDVSAMSAAGK